MIVWLWDADGPECRLIGVRGTKEEAVEVCEKFLKEGAVLSAAVELARLRMTTERGTYYEYTGDGWTATRNHSTGEITWVPFEKAREIARMRLREAARTPAR